jgi:hypothetical protein
MPASIITSMTPAVKSPRMAPPSSTSPCFIVSQFYIFDDKVIHKKGKSQMVWDGYSIFTPFGIIYAFKG